jgi:rhomboid family GlyGly-CTERM serine protease
MSLAACIIAPPSRASTRMPGLAVILLAAACGMLAVAIFVTPSLSSALQYDRDAVAAGELWRVVTCHWTHWSADHLFWDVTTLAALMAVCLRLNARRTVVSIAIASIAITAGVHVGHPELSTYRGLSGIDSTLTVLLAVSGMRSPNSQRPAVLACAGLLAAIVAKLLYELTTGGAVFVDADRAGFVSVPAAHAIGAIVGAAVALIPAKRRRFP